LITFFGSSVGFLLILGSKLDPHVSRVCALVEKSGDTQVVVLDHKSDCRAAFSVARDGGFDLEIDGVKVPSNAVVWARTKFIEGSILYPEGDAAHTRYVVGEWKALHELIAMVFDGRVVNSLDSRRRMSKPFQQMIASSAGFLVPTTLIGTDKNRIDTFLNDLNSDAVLKSLSKSSYQGEAGGTLVTRQVATLRVNAQEVQSSAESSFSACPHFFQEELSKRYELRVVVIGEKTWAFRINSQDFQSSKLDWRMGYGLVSFSNVELEPKCNEAIKRFMSGMGYVFGSIDLIVDDNNEIWFLECNQDGAWAWLDDQLGGALARDFASELRFLAKTTGSILFKRTPECLAA
jgi:glutathione synthase/RimK-type ligase-like ATP-grasp enzyme